MPNRRIIILRSVAVVMLMFGLIILGYFWQELEERGMYADATGTSGHTSTSEVFLIILGGLLTIAFVGLLVVLRRKKSSDRS